MSVRPTKPSPLSQLIAQWKTAQCEMRKRMIVRPLSPLPRFVAGADAAFSSDKKTIFATTGAEAGPPILLCEPMAK